MTIIEATSPTMSSLRVILFVCFVAIASSELIQFKPCYYSGERGKHCTIKDVDIIPCPEAAKDEACRIKRGEYASIIFKYSIDFDPVKDLKTRGYWSTAVADLPFVGMDTDVCKVTACPVVKNVEKSYNYTLNISKTFPAQKFDIKWKIWEDKAGPERECCFMFKMKLV